MPFALQHTPLRADSEEQNNDTFIDTEAAMKIAAVYENVTQSIIAELERGTAPWVKPWKAGKRVGIMPANAITGHHYRGINVPILWHAADERGFPTNALAHLQAGARRGRPCEARARKARRSSSRNASA